MLAISSADEYAEVRVVPRCDHLTGHVYTVELMGLDEALANAYAKGHAEGYASGAVEAVLEEEQR